MKGIAAGIVSYNPSITRLKENINSIRAQVESMLIVDNGSDNIDKIEPLCIENDCDLIKIDENKGIAYALNQICEFYYSKGFDWVLTLDQDSVSPNDMICKLSACAKPKVGVVGPKIVYRHNEEYKNVENVGGTKSVEWLITSASLTNLKAWYAIGGFDEALFIDGVDKDFCIRLRNKGFQILQCNDVELMHELGNLKCKRVLGKTIYVTNHSAKRKYYMARNSIYLDSKHKMSNSFVYILKLIMKTIIFEKDRLSKTKHIIYGVKDGRKMISEVRNS